MVRARNESPTRRIVVGYQGAEYVVELRASEILIRPKGSRSGGPAEVATTPSAIHDRLLLAREQRLRRVGILE